MQTLDPTQLELAGAAVVEASAGTGKTYTITSLFLRLLLERDLSIDQILVVTYTRAATAELRSRIRKRLSAALSVARGEPTDDAFVSALCSRTAARLGAAEVVVRIERALASMDEAPVLTIHGFCQRVLRDHAFESGSAFDTELTTHAAPVLEEIADDYFTRELYDAAATRASVLLNEPALLRRLAARVGGRGVRVVPENIAEQSCDDSDFRAVLEQARALFASQREHITALVSGLKGLGEKSAAKAAGIAAGLLDAGDPQGNWEMTSFCNFTRTGVQSKARGPAPEHAFFDLAERLQVAASALCAAQKSLELAFRRGFVDYLDSELERRTRERNVRTFDALLGDLDKALQGANGGALRERLRHKYKAALVDEFQDTDPMQYRIFRGIFAGTGAPLLLIGDPKQAIYGFRGADVAAYLDARREAGERVYTLDVNYRSDPALIHALNALYARVERPFLRSEIAYYGVQAPPTTGERFSAKDGRSPVDVAFVELGELSAEALRRELAEHVASDIAALLASERTRHDGNRFVRLSASNIAVLCRTNNEAAQVQLALSARGVPSVLTGDASVFDSDDAPELERALTAMAHPADPRALRSFLASRYGGYDAERLLALEADDVAWEAQRERMQRLHTIWSSHGFMRALRTLIHEYDVERRLLTQGDGTRRITNLWHLAELIAEAALAERLGPLGILRWLALVQGDEGTRSELAGDAHELRLESGDDAVTLTTVHKSKGLEYPLVYCPFLWDAAKLYKSERELVRFHDPEKRGALTIDLGSPDKKAHEGLAEEEALAEALRLLYVALTRAKHRVTLLVPSSDAFAKSALAYTLFGGGEREALQTRLVEQTKQRALAPLLRAESERSGGCFSLRKLELGKTTPYLVRASAATLAARPIRRALDLSYRVASFSALVARERTAYGEAGIDRDAVESALEEGEQPREPGFDAPSSLSLATFPRGAVAGQLVHEVLEHTDFTGSAAELTAVAERFVHARGYPSELVAGLVLGLSRALATPLDASGFSLAQLQRSARIDELEFVFPVDGTLTPRLLERLFRAHAAPPAQPSYASELRELGFDALHGFMRGFIDLVFRHDGRFYIVDYKSNWLGPHESDYRMAALTDAMAHHHYFLQYHLYTVALHRYLGLRLRDYRYDQHFGGVYYLFLRGMAKEHAPLSGVFFDKPAAALIEALDAALKSESEAREARP